MPNYSKLAKGLTSLSNESSWQKALASQAEKQMRIDMMPTARINLPAPGIVVPGKLNNVREAVRNIKGNYGARRVERAADEIPNLERMYTHDALADAFTGDNAAAMMTIKPQDFEKYATPIPDYMSSPQAHRGYGSQFLDDSMKDMTLSEYIDSLSNVKGGFADVPYLLINKEEQGLPLVPFITGHEGRHRNRAIANMGEQSNLVQLLPRRELREPLPRRTQEEYIEALKQELEMTNNKVRPQVYFDNLRQEDIKRPRVDLPDIYADGGSIQGGLSRFADGGAAFGVMPQMKPRRAHQDREASKNVPVDAARGFVAGALGQLGDLESLIRMLPYLDEKTILPTSEEIEKRLPFKSDTPVSRAATGLGQLGGSFYTGPGSGFHALGSAYKGAKTLGKELAETAGHRIATGQSLIPGVPASLANPPVMHIVKPTDGNWLPSTDRIVYRTQLDRELENLQKGKHNPNSQYIKEMLEDAVARGDAPQVAGFTRDLQNAIGNEATNKWVKSNLSNYITKQMGTEADPVRKLAEEGITAFPKNVDEYGDLELHTFPNFDVKGRREEFGSPVKGVAQNPLAKHYEFLADQAISPIAAKHYQRIQALPSMQRPVGNTADMPWVNKLDPETNIYSLNTDADFSKMGFDHIMDVLREDVAAGRIRPEQLNKVSMEDAVRRTHQYDEELKQKMLNARVAEQTSAKVHKEYPEGYKWVQLDQPGQFALESDIMGHSVRGYEPPQGHPDWTDISGNSGYNDYGHGGYEAIKSGAAKIYSLRDPKGMSHATIEVNQTNLATPQNFKKAGLDYSEAMVEAKRRMGITPENQKEWVQNANSEQRAQASNDLYKHIDDIYKEKIGNMPQYITQIKGKQNAAPNKEYLPYIQDFVKSGKYTEVGDLQNTGLKHIESVPERASFADAGMNVPEYLTDAEHEKLIYDYLNLTRSKADPKFMHEQYGFPPPPEGMAEGGAIHMQVGGLSALAKLGKAGTKLSKAEEAALRARGLGVPSVDFADPMNPKDIMRMSEALGNAGAEGMTLNLTQADRSRVFGPNKGGTGFSGLQLTSKPHQKAGTTWGVGKPSHATRLINANTPDTVWSTFVGSPTQHMSNPVTVERMYEAHRAANPSADLIDKMNAQVNGAVHPKSGKLIFPEGIDVSDPTVLDKAKTFDQRKVLAQAMTMGGEKRGEKATQEAFKIIREETDPLLANSPTYAVGNRLFTIDSDTGIYRPDLNAAFPHQVTGTDLGLLFEPAPVEFAAPDFVAKYANRKNKAGNPQPMGHKDLTATTPKQFVSEDYLTNLQKEGHKDGGSVEQMSWLDALNNHHRKMAGGGVVNMSDTTPDVTDGENIIPHSFYAKGGQVLSYEDSNNFLRNMYGN